MTEIRDGKQLDLFFCNSKGRADIERHIAEGFPSPVSYEVEGGVTPINLVRTRKETE